MMGVIWRKIWRDIWHNKLRTLLVMLSTAVGVAALGFVFGSSGVMREQMTISHRASNAPHLQIYTSRFEDDVVEAVLREPGVSGVQGQTWSSFRWRRVGDQDWREGWAIARANYGEATGQMYPIQRLAGQWPDERTLSAERMSSNYFDLPLGTVIEVEIGQRAHPVEITGVARHPYVPPPQIGMGETTFIATTETVAWLTGEPEGFTELNVQIESFSQAAAEEMAERVKNRLETLGVAVWFWEIVDPDVHWAQDMIDTVFVILGVLGGLSLALSGFLIINVINATMVQQTWQIGVMKVVGATVGRVIRIYLMMVSVYGLLSLLVALPLGALAAHSLSVWMLDMFNIVVDEFMFVPAAVGLQILVGFFVPVISALVPVVGGALVSPHRAINSHGLGGKFGQGILDRLLGRVRYLSRPLALSLRNTFRRKARVMLTLIALTLGGVMFIMVLSVSASFDNTINVLLSDFGFDVNVSFDRPYHIERLVRVTEATPGVERVEIWDRRGGQLALPNGEDMDVGVWGVPSGSEMFNPRIVSGRPLSPDDEQAILLNHKIAVDEGFGVGDEVELTIMGRESTWTVVGLILNINNNYQDNFVSFDALAGETGSANQGTIVLVTGSGSQQQLIDDLHDSYAEARVAASYYESAEEIRRQNLSSFNVIVYLMLAMAILAAIVGGIGLMSTMAINVVERGREIGVMRSIGATSRSIAGIFVAEGVLVGVLSWLLATPLSYPGAQVFSQAVGKALMQTPLDFAYPVQNAALWFVIVVVLSALASLWPALRATNVSVRESLAYE